MEEQNQLVGITNNKLGISEPLAEKVADYARKGLEGAANTQRAYKSDLKYFKKWCAENGQSELPATASTLAAYVSHLADTHKWASINRKLAAISKLHELNNLDLPTKDHLNDMTVYDSIKKYFGNRYSAHSLRASFITIAKINGADDSEIMRQSKHKTSLMIQRYTRIEDIKQHNAATKLGL